MKTKIYVVEHRTVKPGKLNKSLILLEDDSDVEQIIRNNEDKFGLIENVYPLKTGSLLNYFIIHIHNG